VETLRPEISAFEKKAGEIASFLEEKLEDRPTIDIFTHADADGISAASIFATCLHVNDVPFRIKFTRPFGARGILELGKLDDGKRFFVFIDQGSREIPTIRKAIFSKGHDVLVLDHHPGGPVDEPGLMYLNPHLMGMNGAKEACASTVVYSVVEKIDERVKHQVWLALVGAIGDRQEFPSGFTGINEILFRKAVERGVVTVKEGLKLLDREFFPAAECLRLSVRPYLPNVSGNPSACVELVQMVGVPSSLSIDELGIEKEKLLCDALIARLGIPESDFHHVVWGPVYYLKKHKEFPNLRKWAVALDASDTYEKPEIGFAANMGDEEARDECLLLLQGFERRMLENMEWLKRNVRSFEVTSKARYVRVGKEVPASEMGEMLSLALESRLVEADRPVIGLAEASEDEMKISGRATFDLTAGGIDIGKAMSEAAKAVGGEGGGHDVSGAAYVPRDRVDDFIRVLEQNLG